MKMWSFEWGPTMSEQNETNLTNTELWVRLVYMVVFALLLTIARLMIWAVAALQFLLVLFTRQDNTNLRKLGQGATLWIMQAHLFLTFNSEDKPFPFSDWPELAERECAWTGTAGRQPAADTDVPGEDDDIPSLTGRRRKAPDKTD